MNPPLVLRGVPRLLAVLACCLVLDRVALAQESEEPRDETGELAPIEELQGRFHMTPEDVVNILSTQSLMLTSAQVRLIEDAIRTADETEQEREAFSGLTEDAVITQAVTLENLELGAILFLSRERWTFWLNGEAVTPQSLPQGVSVLRVSPAMVEIAWTPDANRPDDVRRVVLAPGQVYLMDEERVMESAEYNYVPPYEIGEEQDLGDSGGEEESNDDDAATDEAVAANPDDLELSAEQAAQLAELQQALSIVSGNASALGLTEQQLQDLQSSLAASGESGSLSPEQQQQLLLIQQATGIGQ